METETDLSAEYRAAIEAHNLAIRRYEAVRDEYRRGAASVTDDVFLAARAAYYAATAEFDVAFAAEAARRG